MKPIRLLAVAAFALPVLAQAHPGHEGHELTWDFAGGATHPLTGWDHLLAMVAVGLWAAQLGGRNRWLVPAAFVGVLTLGATLGHAGLALPGVEQGIAASIAVLGLMIAIAVRLPTATGMAVVGIFALFHGMAHGTEMPANAGGLGYGVGFIASTALLHLVGLALGQATKNRVVISRFAGGLLAVTGAAALVLAS